MATWIREHYRTFVWPALDMVRQSLTTTYPEWPEKSPGVPPWVAEISRRARGGTLPFPELNQLREYCKQNQHSIFLPKGGLSIHMSPWGITETWKRARNSFASAVSKADGRTLLLAGRDVWVFKVLAEKSRVPAIYIPEISRVVSYKTNLLRALLIRRGVTGREFLVDTGFMGSIPRAISVALETALDYTMLSQNPKAKLSRTVNKENILALPNQVFPNMRGSRSFALWMEYLPKYFLSGKIKQYPEDRIGQELSDDREIIRCAVMTSCIWHGIDDWEKVFFRVVNE